MIQTQTVNAAHDLSDGGLAVTLSEMAIHSGKGAQVSVQSLGKKTHEVLYSEAQSGIVVTVSSEKLPAFEKEISASDIKSTKLGVVAGKKLIVDRDLNLSVADLKEVYESAIPKAMAQ